MYLVTGRRDRRLVYTRDMLLGLKQSHRVKNGGHYNIPSAIACYKPKSSAFPWMVSIIATELYISICKYFKPIPSIELIIILLFVFSPLT